MHSLRSTTKKSTKTGDSIRQLSDPEPNGKSVILVIHQGFNSVTLVILKRIPPTWQNSLTVT